MDFIASLISKLRPPPNLPTYRPLSLSKLLANAQSGDLLLSGGNYSLSILVRSLYRTVNSHCAVLYRHPPSQKLYALTAFDWDSMAPVFPKQDMVDLFQGKVHSGVTMHPLEPYIRAELLVEEGIWIHYRELSYGHNQKLTKEQREYVNTSLVSYTIEKSACVYPSFADHSKRVLMRGRGGIRPGNAQSMDCWEVSLQALQRARIMNAKFEPWRTFPSCFEEKRLELLNGYTYEGLQRVCLTT